ncbi:MAG: hypothetical protein QOK29_3052 [Rhodospirillaceae bacterium]|nr:hypothetical protein [Rhodospirillaceae bacterium]
MGRVFLGRMSLKAILILGAVVLALVPVVVLGGGSMFSVRSLITSLLANRDRIIAQAIGSHVDDFLDSRQRLMQMLGELAASQPQLDEASLGPILATARRNHPSLTRIFVADTHGVSIAADPPVAADGKSSIGLDYSERAYIREVLRTHQAVVDKNLILGKAANQYIAVIAAPILDRAGQIKGVVAAAVDVSAIAGIAEEIKFGKRGSTTIATASGQAISPTIDGVAPEGIDLSKAPIWQLLADRPSGEIESYPTTSGEMRVGGFATVPGVGWKIWVSRAISEVHAEIGRAFQSVAWWVVVALAGAILLAILYARMISRPIESLRTAALVIAEGQFDQKAALRGPREMVDLAGALNHMAQSLRRLVDSERDAKIRIEKAVGEYGALAARVANGDLTAQAPTGEGSEFAQLGTSLNQMIDSLGKLVREIQGAASDITSSASEILAATSQQVSATSEEATAVRQTAATVAEVKQTSDLAAQKAKAVAEAAVKVTRVAQEGQLSVEESIKGSESAKTRMEALAARILTLSEQAHAIAEINATVNDLAEQSNLLAVNASIEAAKAGEAGKGFAVVANEIKALAGQSKQATTQVRGVLNEIQRATQAAVLAAEDGVKSSDVGVIVAGRSGAAIRQLSQNVNEAAQSAQQILAASQQQAIGMDQIAMAMRNIEQSSEQTVSATRQFEGAAKDLNRLARRLTELVDGLSVAKG